ncbi:MAG: nucleotidyltransferase [Hespellia sp.]|nr:nucleotidyltransferase [Hespellia sp.]
MTKPVLVIMAAGMGSRYGGLKQIDPVDEQGHIIMDFSLYDAKKAGFEKVIFIIKRENEADFRKSIGDRMSRHMEVAYVYQELTNLPGGFQVPKGRMKPFGTGHAILSCIDEIDGPFAVINADDYYGRNALKMIYEYLISHEDGERYQYAMVGYVLKNTLTENGHVARGVCKMDTDGYLQGITERTHIEKTADGAAYTEDDGRTWTSVSPESVVSMNMFGFTRSMLLELRDRFSKFLEENLKSNPLKCEYFLPTVVGELLREDKAAVRVLRSEDRWYGVTYKEDKAVVTKAIQEMKEAGMYPTYLWLND